MLCVSGKSFYLSQFNGSLFAKRFPSFKLRFRSICHQPKVFWMYMNTRVLHAGLDPQRNLSTADCCGIKLINDFNDLDDGSAVGGGTNQKSDTLIECRDIFKSLGGKNVLKGVSFKIRHGEAVGIIGPSGTGKSTILKIIAGLLAPDKGEVLIQGRKRDGLIDDGDDFGLRIRLVFQSAALFDSLTVRENVGFLLYENSTLSENQISELVRETLAAVGLKVLLYDEPTAGLDPIASTVVEDLIRSVHSKGSLLQSKTGKIASYVVVTHQHSTILRAVDRLLFLDKGKVVWQGMTEEFSTSSNPAVKQFASGSLDGPIEY